MRIAAVGQPHVVNESAIQFMRQCEDIMRGGVNSKPYLVRKCHVSVVVIVFLGKTQKALCEWLKEVAQYVLSARCAVTRPYVWVFFVFCFTSLV